MRPLCFVLMPFGRKPDPARSVDLPFDDVYAKIIAPAIEEAGMEPIRGDAEVEGGIVQRIMFERLVLCDYAVADLTTGNPNVYYELGIRHATRPHTTIPICATYHLPLPFDVQLVRSEAYELQGDNSLTEAAASAAREQLVRRLHSIRETEHEGFLTDSPVYQLLNGLEQPDIERLRSEAFHEQARYSTGLRNRLGKALRHAKENKELGGLHELAQEVLPHGEEFEAAFLADLFMAHRDAGDFEGVVKMYPELPKVIARSRLIREQYGLALNRVGESGEALDVLNEVANEGGHPSSETQGLIGRIHKDRWKKAHLAGSPAAAQFLRDAIAAYRKGFEADWRDAYPGINLLSLLAIEGSKDSLADRDRLVPVIQYAVDRRLADVEQPDYWDYATLLELAIHASDRESANRFLGSALSREPVSWMVESTAENLGFLAAAREGGGEDASWIRKVVDQLTS